MCNELTKSTCFNVPLTNDPIQKNSCSKSILLAYFLFLKFILGFVIFLICPRLFLTLVEGQICMQTAGGGSFIFMTK